MTLPGVVYRSREFSVSPDVSDANDTSIRMTASTNAPVQIPIEVDGERQMWDEVLEHGIESVDTSAARSLLINHDSDQIVGTVRTVTLDGTTAQVAADILPGAKLASGVSVLDAVRSGALKGVSIGYTYRMDDDSVSVDGDARCITVRKWRMLEVTLTPIPADPSAGVRSMQRSLLHPQKTKEVTMPEVSDIKPEAKTDVEAVRSEAAKVVALAESHKLRASDFVGLTLADAQGKMLAAIAERDAKAGAAPKVEVRSHIEVGEGHAEKVAKQAVGALLHNAGFRASDPKAAEFEFEDGTKLRDYQDGNKLRSATVSDIIRATIQGLGERSGDFDRHALAAIALGRRDAANVQTGYFSTFVFANLLKKSVQLGYSMGGRSIRYQDIVGRNYVPDYKQFAVGAIGVGNLQSTAENQAFPELDKTEGAYFDRVQMWGGTISLSEQAIVSDDTGRFMENLRMAGVICQKTIDKQVFATLLAGPNSTWAGASAVNTTSSATIVNSTADSLVAARANLSKVQAAMMNKVGLDGNPLGAIASSIVVPPSLAHTTRGLLGIAPGQQSNTNIGLNVIDTPWLEASVLTGNSSTTYYLIADPSEASGLILSTINGLDSPKVEQYDPGAVAAYKWKIYMPFAVGFSQATYAGNTVVAGVQRGTT